MYAQYTPKINVLLEMLQTQLHNHRNRLGVPKKKKQCVEGGHLREVWGEQ